MGNHPESYSGKDDVPSVWPDPLWAMRGSPYYPHPSVPQSTHPVLCSAAGYSSTAGSYLPDPGFNAADDAAFSLGPIAEIGVFANLPIQADSINQVLDPWSVPATSLFDANSAFSQPELVENPDWTLVDPLAAGSVATTPDSGASPVSTAPTSQDKWTWLSDLLHSPSTTQASSPGYGGEAGWVTPEQGASVSDVTASPAGWDAIGFSWPIPAAPGDVTSNVTTTFAPGPAFWKRRCEEEQLLGDGGSAGAHTQEIPPLKRARGSGTLNAARSAARTRCKPVTRIPIQWDGNAYEEAGRGAERLATQPSQGIHHQPLPGPSIQQGWSVDAADGESTRVEGSVDEEVVHHVNSTVQQQHGKVTGPFEIPCKFKPEYRLLLQASQAEFERGVVQEIKCRLCPGTNLKDFEDFKRHCMTTETHPFKIRFCDHCGDFFARTDSLKRHRKHPPARCRKVTPAKAKEKRRVTKEAHEDFVRQMKHALLTGEGIGRGFSQIIKEIYPQSSKKRTRGTK